MSAKQFYTLAAFGLLAAVALVLVIIGVTGHEEAGFSSDSRWDHVPLSVSCSTVDECGTAEYAVEAFNERAGFLMLYWDPEAAAADIEISVNAPYPVSGPTWDTPGGHFVMRGNTIALRRCSIETSNVLGFGDLEHLVIFHELGHCVGLAHDDFETSIMRPTQSETPDGTFPATLTDSDVESIRARYHGPGAD